MHKDNFLSQSQRERGISGRIDSKEISSVVDMVGQHLDISFLGRQLDSEGNKVAPLYQRVLAAMVVEDQIDETDDSLDVELKSMIGTEFESESLSSLQVRAQYASDMLPCNGNTAFTSHSNPRDQELDDLLPVQWGLVHSETEMFPMLSKNGSGGLLAAHVDTSHSSSFNCQFEKMNLEDKILLELQSVGLYPEAVVSFQFNFK